MRDPGWFPNLSSPETISLVWRHIRSPFAWENWLTECMMCWAGARHKFCSDFLQTATPTRTRRSLLFGYGDTIVIILVFFFYFLRHDEIWLFKCEPLSAMAFYLTSSELVLWQLLGKPTVVCSTRIAVYPEGLCSVFILPVWKLTRTLTTKWILVCYPGKTSPQQPHSWQGKHALGDIDWESASQLC